VRGLGAESRGGVRDRQPGVFEHSPWFLWQAWTNANDKMTVRTNFFTKQYAYRKILKHKLCSYGSQQKGAGSQLWGAGSVIRGSGPQIRGAGSEIQRHPPQFNPYCLKLMFLDNTTASYFSKLSNFGRKSYNFDHVKSYAFHRVVW